MGSLRVRARWLLNAQQRHIELQHSVHRDKPRDGLISVGQMRRDAKAPLATNTHPFDSELQTGNHAPLANAKRILLILLDQLAAIQEQVVSNVDLCTSIGACAISEFDVFVFDAGATAFHRSMPTWFLFILNLPNKA
jgi:hypothetical protein